ncbi:hypothetical protein EJB05_50234, partial [Eragrostis curvula]
MAETLKNTQMANQGVFGYFAAAFSYLGLAVPGMPPMPPMVLPSLVPPQGVQPSQITAAPGMFTTMLSAPMTPAGQLSQSSLGLLATGVSGMAGHTQAGPSSVPSFSPGQFMTPSAFLLSTTPVVAPVQHITSVTRISSPLPVSALDFSGIESPITSAPATTSVVFSPVVTEAVITTSEVTAALETSSSMPAATYKVILRDMLDAGYDEVAAEATALRVSSTGKAPLGSTSWTVSEPSSDARSRTPSVHTASEPDLGHHTAEDPDAPVLDLDGRLVYTRRSRTPELGMPRTWTWTAPVASTQQDSTTAIKRKMQATADDQGRITRKKTKLNREILSNQVMIAVLNRFDLLANLMSFMGISHTKLGKLGDCLERTGSPRSELDEIISICDRHLTNLVRTFNSCRKHVSEFRSMLVEIKIVASVEKGAAAEEEDIERKEKYAAADTCRGQ